MRGFVSAPDQREARAARHTDGRILTPARVTCGPDCSCHGRGSTVEEIVLDTRYHDGDGGCGYAWSVHDTTDRYATLPFGCPTEAIARARWGR